MSILSSILAGVGGIYSAKMTQAEAQRNRDFQKMMSDTSYQRAVKDMRAAGINPMLAYAQGGSSTPSGSMASYGNPLDTAAYALNESESIRNLKRAQQSQIELNRTQSELNSSAAALNASREKTEESTRAVNAASVLESATRQQLNQASAQQAQQQTSKLVQDVLNSIRLTDAQVENYAANTAKSLQEVEEIGRNLKKSDLELKYLDEKLRLTNANLQKDFNLKGYQGTNWQRRNQTELLQQALLNEQVRKMLMENAKLNADTYFLDNPVGLGIQGVFDFLTNNLGKLISVINPFDIK